jgi:DNA invertase Pin-like site-specific DNA recombinase
MINFKQWLTLNEGKKTTPEQIQQILDLYNDPNTIQNALNQGTGVIKYIAKTFRNSSETVTNVLKNHGITQDPITTSQLFKAKWNTPEFRTKVTQGYQSPEIQERNQQTLHLYHDPQTKEKALDQNMGVIKYIAQTLNINRYTVKDILKKHGITTKEPITQTQLTKHRHQIPEQQILDLYNDPTTIEKALNQNMGVFTYIAKTLNIGKTTVITKLKNYGITQDHITPSQIHTHRQKNPELRERERQTHKLRWQNMTPEEREKEREKISQQIKQLWKDPEYLKKMLQRWTPEEREKNSQRLKQYWQNMTPEERVDLLQRIRAAWTPELRKKMSQIQKLRWQNMTPEERAKMLDRPNITDFWSWIDTFPPEKQTQILAAIFTRQ